MTVIPWRERGGKSQLSIPRKGRKKLLSKKVYPESTGRWGDLSSRLLALPTLLRPHDESREHPQHPAKPSPAEVETEQGVPALRERGCGAGGGSPPAPRRAVPGRPRALAGREGEGGGYSPGSWWRPKLAQSGSGSG